MKSENQIVAFSNALQEWHKANPRLMPWKTTRDPYHIWMSEIILQQTQVVQGRSYYEKFIKHYPTVYDLAKATEDRILNDWQGLGYNSRARNLHSTAQYIVEKLNGKFPSTYDGLLALKGVGPYTAAAIASFAYDLPHPVVDANVKRVYARFFGIQKPIEDRSTHKLIEGYAKLILGKHPPAFFNQAIMNFGALQCGPKKPDCSTCPVSEECVAFRLGQQHTIPVRLPKKKRKKRFFHYFVFYQNDQFLLRKRVKSDIWQNMFDFPLIEKPRSKMLSLSDRKEFLHTSRITKHKQIYPPKTYRQTLTHRIIHATFYTYELNQDFTEPGKSDYLVEMKNLSTFAFPKIVRLYLEEQWSIN
jgi:A/G-specific adenine glycosylase